MPKNATNIYICQKCNGHTVTIDVDEGTTPFMSDCRASGREGDCDGDAYSSFYRTGPQVPKAAWEWYRPVGDEYAALDTSVKEQHVDLGGLLLRKRSA